MPPGHTSANPPSAGSAPQSFEFLSALTPRPCGEMTSGSGGGRWSGPYCAGRTIRAGRRIPLCAREWMSQPLTPPAAAFAVGRPSVRRTADEKEIVATPRSLGLSGADETRHRLPLDRRKSLVVRVLDEHRAQVKRNGSRAEQRLVVHIAVRGEERLPLVRLQGAPHELEVESR